MLKDNLVFYKIIVILIFCTISIGVHKKILVYGKSCISLDSKN